MLPSLDPAETIFSWGAKTRLALGVSARQLSLQLFGSLRAGHSHDLPSCLANVERVTGVSIGPASTIVRHHSLFGTYLALADSDRAAEIETAFFSGQTQKAHMLLGLRANKVGARHALRYCRVCAEDDQMKLGYPRWIVDQQLPASWLCRVHETPLVELDGIDRPWQLPMEERRARAPHPPPVGVGHALAIAAEVGALLLRSEGVRSSLLRQAALARMVHTRIIKNPARLNDGEVQGAFLRSSIAAFLTRRPDLAEPFAHQAWIVALVRGRTATHPAKWAILWAWLWESEPLPAVIEAFERAVAGEYLQDDTSQASLWPIMLDSGAEITIRRVHEAMQESDTLERVAMLSKTSLGVLRSWMKSHDVLRESWVERKQKVREARSLGIAEELAVAVAAEGIAGRTEFVERNRKSVAWMRRFDPERLDAILRSLPSMRSSQGRLF